MVRKRSKPRNLTDNHTGENADEVPADYERRQDRINEGVIGTKTYPAQGQLGEVDLLSNIKLFCTSTLV